MFRSASTALSSMRIQGIFRSWRSFSSTPFEVIGVGGEVYAFDLSESSLAVTGGGALLADTELTLTIKPNETITNADAEIVLSVDDVDFSGARVEDTNFPIVTADEDILVLKLAASVTLFATADGERVYTAVALLSEPFAQYFRFCGELLPGLPKIQNLSVICDCCVN